MKNIIIFFFFLFSVSLQAQSLDEFFIFDLNNYVQLNQDQRNILLNQYASKKNDKITTMYGGTARMLEYEKNNYLKVKTSDQGYFSIKRWLLNDTVPMFGVSFWVCGTACDGWIDIKNKKNLPVPSIPNVSIVDFFQADSLSKYQMTADSLSKKFEMTFFHYEFTKGDTIFVVNDLCSFLDEDRNKKYSKFWKGDKLPIIFKNNKFTKLEPFF